MKRISSRPIGIIRAEGIGPEVMDAAEACLSQIARSNKGRFQLIQYTGPAPTHGKRLGQAKDALRRFYAEIKETGGVILRSSFYAQLVYQLREDFNMHYKLIPLQPIPELYPNSPLKPDVAKKIKLLLVRDNAQGLYHGKERQEKSETGQRIVRLSCTYDEGKIRQIARVAFESAAKNRRIVKLLIKCDVLPTLTRMWLEIFEEMNKRFPAVEFDWDHPDAGLADLLINPEGYGVLVALDPDADMISDFLSCLLHGTRAITPSGNFDSASGFATYQTIHGCGVALGGKNKANPIGMIMAVAMLLEYSLEMPLEAESLRGAVRKVLFKGYRTADIFLPHIPSNKLVGTLEMRDRIVEEIRTSHLPVRRQKSKISA